MTTKASGYGIFPAIGKVLIRRDEDPELEVFHVDAIVLNEGSPARRRRRRRRRSNETMHCVINNGRVQVIAAVSNLLAFGDPPDPRTRLRGPPVLWVVQSQIAPVPPLHRPFPSDCPHPLPDARVVPPFLPWPYRAPPLLHYFGLRLFSLRSTVQNHFLI